MVNIYQLDKIFSRVPWKQMTFEIFHLKMQNDGNLVQYLVDTTNSAQYAYYATDLHNSTDRLRNLTRGNYVEKGPLSICYKSNTSVAYQTNNAPNTTLSTNYNILQSSYIIEIVTAGSASYYLLKLII